MHSRIPVGLLGLLTLLAVGRANADGKTAAPSPSRPDSVTEFRAGANLALQGDVPAALGHLKNVDPSVLDDEKRRTTACILERFSKPAPRSKLGELDPWSASVLGAYRVYWQRGLLHSNERSDLEMAEADLFKTLSTLLRSQGKSSSGKPAKTVEDLEPEVQSRLEAHGLHALLGLTPPLRELMLWRTQEEKTYDVDLPGGPEHVLVEMLDGFSSLGWAGYATCDYYHSAGWTETDRLYCVRSAYDLDSESFRVSYLAHEGQHFADKRRFPNLEAPELEYRAKLVEIARADATLDELLQGFGANVSDNRDQPHSFANARLLKDLAGAVLGGKPYSEAAWKTVDRATLHAAALRLLVEDNQKLQVNKQP